MAKVTFVQIGNDSMLHSDYKSKLSTALTQYPGAIIFGTYYDDVKKKVCQEIWANGKQYSVGAGSDARFYDSSLTPEAYFTEHPEETPLHGDYYIKTTDLNGVPSDNIEERTAYVYDSVNNKWVALSGNYDANNVYFPQGIDRTEAWGVATKSTTINKEECKNKNLKELLENYLVKEQFPKSNVNDYKSTGNRTLPTWSVAGKTIPTITVKKSDKTTNFTSGSTVEVGTVLYIPQKTYDPTVDAKETWNNVDTAVQDGSITTKDLGPSKLSNMTYGFWPDGVDKTEANRIDLSTITFNGQNLTVDTSHGYVPMDTRTTANMTYTYVPGATKIEYVSSGFDASSGNWDKDDEGTGNTSLSLDSEYLIVRPENNSIKLGVKNNNYWKREVSSNTIPDSSYVYVASNKYHATFTDTEGTTQTQKIRVDGSVVGADSSKKLDSYYNKVTYGTEVTAEGVYPVYSNGTTDDAKMGDISTVNHKTISTHPSSDPTSTAKDPQIFSKSTGNNVPYYFMVPSFLGRPKVQIWALSGTWGDWTPDGVNRKISRGHYIDVNDKCKKIEYTKIEVSPDNAPGVLYRITEFPDWD